MNFAVVVTAVLLRKSERLTKYSKPKMSIGIAMQSRSMCFEELYYAKKEGQIGLEDYMQQLVAHYGGLRHEADEDGKRPYFPPGFEEEVRDVVLHPEFQPLNKDRK